MGLGKISDIKHFNSHAHVERDYCPYCNGGGHDNFNSHAHVERDENNFKNANKCGNFNSHAHVERDCTERIGRA